MVLLADTSARPPPTGPAPPDTWRNPAFTAAAKPSTAAGVRIRRPAADLEHMRQKLLLHLRQAADRINLADSHVAPPPRPRRRPPPADVDSTSSPPSPEKRATRRRLERSPPRAKFSVALSREEIEEDIYAVTGGRARRRPRRRPRAVQKQLDVLFPGSWLSEITAEMYRVPE